VTTMRESGRQERRLLHAWTRRTLLTAGVVAAGWLFLGGSPAEAASAGPSGPADTALAAAHALGSASESAQPSGVGIVEQAVARDVVGGSHGRSQHRSQALDDEPTVPARADRVDEVIDDTVRAVETNVESTGQATQVVRWDVTPTLGAVVTTAEPVFAPVHEVTPAIPGEPGTPSETSRTDRETPGSSVEAPRASTESVAATADSARPSSGSSPTPHSGGLSFPGSGRGSDVGPHPVLPVPGPSQDAPDGTASTATGHGSLDRAQNVSGDTSPLVFAPRLLTSLPATSRPTGTRERATRPSVSPD
jgi:hypothetical protein